MLRPDIAEFLAAVIADDTRSPEDKDRAATALKFYSEKIAEEIKPSDNPALDERERQSIRFFARMGANELWDDPEDCIVKTQTEDGIVHKHVASRTYHDPTYEHYGNAKVSIERTLSWMKKEAARIKQSEEPLPLPAPVPAVPLPVLAPSAEEQKAVSEFDHNRFTPATVATRVAAIQGAERTKELSSVEEIEQEMARWRNLQERIEENQKELARLRALRG